ncbi:hypothetical protein [Schleiferilactobacillus harbinensis]|uniref:Uncharacterized protein n=1 Tax=Schleiferilactobacillus harbinensis TaxID=304207 RepID=A0A5P8M9R0_9LACO|nr:hypothetical protein [Schleiferilactobacillus harbinensis]QFR25054.1 hypothetical protein D1010_17610 [Schleiferilactobacillus harbinensis]
MKRFDTSNSGYELCKASGCLNALTDELDTLYQSVSPFNENHTKESAFILAYESARQWETLISLVKTANDIVNEQIDELDRAPESGDHNDIKHA